MNVLLILVFLIHSFKIATFANSITYLSCALSYKKNPTCHVPIIGTIFPCVLEVLMITELLLVRIIVHFFHELLKFCHPGFVLHSQGNLRLRGLLRPIFYHTALRDGAAELRLCFF